MPAAYDTYDYPSYWEGRDYEHEAEVLAITEFLKKIPKIRTILEIGAGFGRLYDSYSFRAKKVILSDPSAILLKLAREKHSKDNVEFMHAAFGVLNKKLKSRKVDLAVLVRVIHHIEKPEVCFKVINKLLNPRGYFIIEYPNKKHFKAIIKEFLKGNITYTLDIFNRDMRSKKSPKKNALPFVNFHPDKVKLMLEEAGFEIVETRSVSNIRSSLIKRIISKNVLISFEKYLQKPLSYICFGPSIFILARKRG